jgi:undecaprenyl diphosphate synthase
MKNQYNINHVAIIMDGNGRWAQQHGHERSFGHEQGVEAVRNVLEFAKNNGIPYVTLYAFSTENWNRPKEEVDLLMRLVTRTITKEVDTFMKNGVRLLTTGRMEDLPEDCRKSMNDAAEITANNKNTTVIFALSYSGRSELVDTTKKIAHEVAAGRLNPDDINNDTIQKHLYRPEIPDVDLLIRTGGEMRISNFLLWEIAYAELFFSPVLWPDFREEHLKEILDQYTHRERRFGKTGEQVRAH